MNKSKKAQHQNLKEKHPETKWKSGGGSPGTFLKKKQNEAKVRRSKTRHVGRFKHLKSEEQLLFEQKGVKELIAGAQNIEGHLGDVWLQARTSGSKNG